jgi:hypothetical protein
MPHTLTYLHTQATINQETPDPFDTVPEHTMCHYVKQGSYVAFMSQAIPSDSKSAPWRFNIWVNPEDLEIAFQVVSRRLLNTDKGHHYFTARDPSACYHMQEMADQITIYTCVDKQGQLVPSLSDMYWSLSVIEKQLRAYQVGPGVRPLYYQAVCGSNYITMDYQPEEQLNDTASPEIVRQINSVHNPFRLFATPSSPLRIDYDTLDEFREAKAAYKASRT